MVKSNRQVVVTCVCALILLVGMALFSTGASRSRMTTAQQNNLKQPSPKKDLTDLQQEKYSRFPSTDYDAPEPTNPEERERRRKKNKHYDGRHLVPKNPPNGITGATHDDHAFFALPGLPTAQSDVILTADVLTSEAHLSNDKKGVYSEFTVQVNEILKGSVSKLSQSNLIDISRAGGVVRYSSGQVLRYDMMLQLMPAIGKRYLFFLKAIPDSDDFEIVTGYEIGSQRVQPLDGLRQFDSYRGKSVSEFINIVRDAIAKN